MRKAIGILHPGQMGISIANAAVQGAAVTDDSPVYWVSEGRSKESIERAGKYGLRDAGSIAALCEKCRIIVSVCPPHAAEEVATEVVAAGFTGLYVDANAIAPERTERIGRMVVDRGAAFVDGGIVGPPAWQADKTWLYLSGAQAQAVADCFADSLLNVRVISEIPGKASALKMCYAAFTKGTTALLSAVLATAEQAGVREELERQWSYADKSLVDRRRSQVLSATAKAWRFTGEMDEIAATFEQAGLPGSFHRAAADVYRRLAHFKGAAEGPSLETVLAALLEHKK